MNNGFRKSMAALHTWAGVVVGALLFAIFWMGSLSVFDREIDRWMMPGTRIAPAAASHPMRFDGPVMQAAAELSKGSSQWYVRTPSERVPAIELRWRDDKTKTFERRYLHPQTGAVLPHTNTLAGTGFIFPFHFNLHLKWLDLGYWLVGLAGMTMMVMVVSGVVIHRKIFADFFLFRPRKHLQRASLDLHNLTGVLLLPFHFLIALSGLIIFMNIYLPFTAQGVYSEARNPREAFFSEAFGTYRRAKVGKPMPGRPASIDAMADAARLAWSGGEPGFMRVWHPGDAQSYVEIRRGYEDTVTMSVDTMYFDAVSGVELHRFTAAPVVTAQRFISGMHFIQFRHWTLRGLYFLAGLAGCVVIATGFLFWIESRRANHARKGLHGVRIVQALVVAAVPGLLCATMTFFIANRLLPADATWRGLDRAGLELLSFYLSWLVALAHATVRAQTAWQEQTVALAVAALLAVATNWATTGQHFGVSVAADLWAVAGVDMALIALGVAAALTAGHLRPRRRTHGIRRGGPERLDAINITSQIAGLIGQERGGRG